MRAEIISVGEELLLGEIIDTNASEMAERLSDLGVEVVRRTTIGDHLTEIGEALAAAVERVGSGLVLVTGGLGPTADDITREALAAAAGRRLVFSADLLEGIAKRFGRSIEEIPPTNRRQAFFPEGARVLPNAHGTAPGIELEWRGARVFLLPGVPREMRAMLADHVLPAVSRLLRERGEPVARVRRLHLSGLGESAVAEKIDHLMAEGGAVRVGTRASSGVITARILARAAEAAEAERLVAGTEAEIRALLGEYIYGADEESPAAGCARVLLEKKLTVAVAESCTGGLLAGALTAVPGVSAAFLLGAVTYSNEAKTRLLGVPAELIEEKGAVSEEVADAMASGVRKLAGADIAVAVTGIAGPDGGTAEKPVGTVCFAVATSSGVEHETRRFPPASREGVRGRSVNVALALLRRAAEGARRKGA